MKYKGCPHCGCKEFYTMGNSKESDSHIILKGAKKIGKGAYQALEDNVIFATPFICKECDFVQFFRAN